MALTNNQTVLDWIDEMAAMTQPEHIVWIDGSDAQMEELRAQACATGELEKLNQESCPAAIFTAPLPTMWLVLRPNLHLLQETGGRRSHQQLDGPGGNVRQAEEAVYRSHEGPHHVRHSLLHGRGWLSLRQVRY